MKRARLQPILLKAFVWVLLVVFALTSVGVALFTFSTR
jgi:hypothetical protein